MPTLEEFVSQSVAQADPWFTESSGFRVGGVDPLGLRQTNFDQMDQVLPGINNVARHIRPFVVVTWAWRRAREIARSAELQEIEIKRLRDFVDRIEVIYTWSQFLINPDADLPGRQVLSPIIRAASWRFGGPAWERRRKERRYSTAFTAAITYGPALKSLGWVEAHPQYPEVLLPTHLTTAAVDAFQGLIAGHLEHPAFSTFGDITVTADDVRSWAELWTLGEATEAEQFAMQNMLFGENASPRRKAGGALLKAASGHALSIETSQVRKTMAGMPSNFSPHPELTDTMTLWRQLQVRQLFRFALEALFYWTITEIGSSSKNTATLARSFRSKAGLASDVDATRRWFKEYDSAIGPLAVIDRIQTALDTNQADLAAAIALALPLCMGEAPEQGQNGEKLDRLPLYKAKKDVQSLRDQPIETALSFILESWILAQHAYWSVGRGLGDARARGKMIMRLRIVMEEGGWTMAPGAQGTKPRPTADRLQTAISLAVECGYLNGSSAGADMRVLGLQDFDG